MAFILNVNYASSPPGDTHFFTKNFSPPARLARPLFLDAGGGPLKLAAPLSIRPPHSVCPTVPATLPAPNRPMELRKTCLAGRDCLEAINTLLHRLRLEDPFAELHDAIDPRWWWREDDAPHPERQIFWQDETGPGPRPVAALLLYDEGRAWQCDFLRLPSLLPTVAGALVAEVLGILSRLAKPVRVTLRESDEVFRGALEGRGWQQKSAAVIQAKPVAAVRSAAAASQFPRGYRIESRAECPARPHPLAHRGRNPPDVEEQLAGCALYRADLDYAVIHTATDTVAAYALFWLDPITRTGLIEPLRTEDGHQRRGLATHLVGWGIRRLVEGGATTIKASYRDGNEAARRLFRRCEFPHLVRKLDYQSPTPAATPTRVGNR